MPLRIAAPVSFSEPIACGFCEVVAPGREFVREQGWPRVQLVARLNT